MGALTHSLEQIKYTSLAAHTVNNQKIQQNIPYSVALYGKSRLNNLKGKMLQSTDSWKKVEDHFTHITKEKEED